MDPFATFSALTAEAAQGDYLQVQAHQLSAWYWLNGGSEVINWGAVKIFLPAHLASSWLLETEEIVVEGCKWSHWIHVMIAPPLERVSHTGVEGLGKVGATTVSVPTACKSICWDGVIKCALGMRVVRVVTALLGLFTCALSSPGCWCGSWMGLKPERVCMGLISSPRPGVML